jgi:hypothetical protein
MVAALFLHLLVAVHGAEQVLDVVHEALAVREAAQQEGLAAVRALGLALFDPCPQAVLAGELAAGRAHAGFLYILEADVALQERQVLPVALNSGLHFLLLYNEPTI